MSCRSQEIPGACIFGDSLEEVPLVGHDGAPQGNISGHGVWNISYDKCAFCFLDPSAAIGIESNDVEVSIASTYEHHYDANDSIGSHDGLFGQ
jgi:hypothetical protein